MTGNETVAHSEHGTESTNISHDHDHNHGHGAGSSSRKLALVAGVNLVGLRRIKVRDGDERLIGVLRGGLGRNPAIDRDYSSSAGR